MPAQAYTIKAGSTAQLLLLYARDPEGGRGKRGVRHDSPGLAVGYVRVGEPARSVTLSDGAVGAWSPGGFVEVDPDLLPGVYQLGAPNEMLATGSTRAVLVIRSPEALFDPVEVDLVAFDPQDQIRLGMTALGPEARIQALQGAFPLLARKEIEAAMAKLAEEAPEKPAVTLPEGST